MKRMKQEVAETTDVEDPKKLKRGMKRSSKRRGRRKSSRY